ncbi:glutaredoxin 3 [Altererythrobacter xiamenensis]|uniref:Glutaredoxin n=2 Tax=Altererythrobacter xiamenensis TaxID=1316679 RepID=A0A1Y6FHV0_9SPHN|nr:glutaredoxin 3 [Altererythrobacter xiamenensis]
MVFQDIRLRELSNNRQGSTMSTPVIDIYTKFGCGFCYRAKSLLDSKGAEYNEFDITMGGPKREEMLERAPNARTVPQIFIGDTYVGGSDELAALERDGKLDTLLAG